MPKWNKYIEKPAFHVTFHATIGRKNDRLIDKVSSLLIDCSYFIGIHTFRLKFIFINQPFCCARPLLSRPAPKLAHQINLFRNRLRQAPKLGWSIKSIAADDSFAAQRYRVHSIAIKLDFLLKLALKNHKIKKRFREMLLNFQSITSNMTDKFNPKHNTQRILAKFSAFRATDHTCHRQHSKFLTFSLPSDQPTHPRTM